MATDSSEAECVMSVWWDEFSRVYGDLHGYLGFATCVLGSLANLTIVSVLVQRHMRTSTNMLLLWIAVADFLMMVACAPTYLHFYICKNQAVAAFCTTERLWIYYFIFYSSFTIVCHTAGIWLTVALALFRLLYLTVKAAPSVKSNTTASLVAATIYLFSVLLTVPNILVNGWSAYNLTSLDTNESLHSLPNSPESQSVAYCINMSEFAVANSQISIINFWISGLFMRLAPSALMIVLTLLLLHQLRSASSRRSIILRSSRSSFSLESHKKQEVRTTTMLLCVVLTFLVVELPQGALSLLNHLDSCFYVGVYQKIGDLIDCLTLIKNLINFVLLTTMSKQFRRTFATLPYTYTVEVFRRRSSKITTSINTQSIACEPRRSVHFESMGMH